LDSLGGIVWLLQLDGFVALFALELVESCSRIRLGELKFVGFAGGNQSLLDSLGGIDFFCGFAWGLKVVGFAGGNRLLLWIRLGIDRTLAHFRAVGRIATRDTVLCAVVLRLFRGSRCRNFSRIRGVGTSWYGVEWVRGRGIAKFALCRYSSLVGISITLGNAVPWVCLFLRRFGLKRTDAGLTCWRIRFGESQFGEFAWGNSFVGINHSVGSIAWGYCN